MLPPLMSIVVAVVGLGLLIAAHEAGHLLLARLMGMRVETYSLGFGPRIAGFKSGDTDYRLSALPLGGYCKIAGFTPDDPAAQDPADTGSYVNKPAWRRFLVTAAGPGVNYLIAFLIIALLYMSTGFVDLTTTRIQVVPGGPAAAAGLQSGDQVLAVDGAKVESFDDLRHELQKAPAKADRQLDVLRGGLRQSYVVHPDKGTISVRLDQSLIRLPPSAAIPRAAAAVWELNAQQLSGIWDLVRRRGRRPPPRRRATVRPARAGVPGGRAGAARVVAVLSVGRA